MLPFLADTFGNPSASHRLGPRGPAGARRRPRHDGRRARAPSRARSCSPAAARRPTTWPSSACSTAPGASRCAPPSSTTPCSSRSSGRAAGSCRSAPTGVIDLDALADALDDDVAVVSVMLVNNEVGDDPAARRGRRRGAPSGRPAPCCTPTRCRRSRWLDVASGRASTPTWCRSAAHKFGGPKGVGALVVRDGVERSRRCCSAAARSASGAAAPRTSPGSWPWPRPRAGRRRAQGAGRPDHAAARPARRRAARALPGDRSRPGRPTPRAQGRRHRPRLLRRRRERGAAVPARRRRASWRPPRRRAPAARRSRRTCWPPWASTAAAGRRLAAAVARLADHRRRRRSRARGRPAAVAAAAAVAAGSMARVLVAMSGGVDSSVAAARLRDDGPRRRRRDDEAVGRRLRHRCCSVSDVDDARRVAEQLGIEHHVFNFGDDFDAHVVDPTWRDHAAGARRTRASSATAT